MENECCFEFNFSRNFERRFLLNGGEYVLKYKNDRNQTNSRAGYYAYNYNYGRLTIEGKKDIPVSVILKVYQVNGSRLFSECQVLQTSQSVFEIDLQKMGYNLSSGTYLCYIKVIRYEKWQKIQESTEKVTPAKNATSSKCPVTECKYENLSSDMRRLLAKGELSDVILSDGSADFRAHKLVLSARSSVFSKMFQHAMKENQENRVTITDVSSEVLKELLIFIYTGVATIKDMKMARELFVVADKYDVKELKAVCSKYLKDVDLNSVLDTLILANLYGDDILKQFALEFITKNYSEVKSQKNWGNFMKNHQVLAMEVLGFVLDKKT